MIFPYTPVGYLGIAADLQPEMHSPWDQPPPQWNYDPATDQGIQHRGVESPTKVPRGVYNPQDYFGRKSEEERAKRTPAGGSWYPAKSDQVWHGSDRAGADPKKWLRGGAEALRKARR